MHFCYVDTAIGRILIAGDDAGLRRIRFVDTEKDGPPPSNWIEEPARFQDAVHQLHEYLAGRLREFDLQLAPEGTAFQQQVWAAVRKIPYGNVVSYTELARQLGKPGAARAVGAANAANPLPLVITCHRVVGSNGDMTGYLGGLDLKRKLLQLEQAGAREKEKAGNDPAQSE